MDSATLKELINRKDAVKTSHRAYLDSLQSYQEYAGQLAQNVLAENDGEDVYRAWIVDGWVVVMRNKIMARDEPFTIVLLEETK